jgi:hypothetical protein
VVEWATRGTGMDVPLDREFEIDPGSASCLPLLTNISFWLDTDVRADRVGCVLVVAVDGLDCSELMKSGMMPILPFSIEHGGAAKNQVYLNDSVRVKATSREGDGVTGGNCLTSGVHRPCHVTLA